MSESNKSVKCKNSHHSWQRYKKNDILPTDCYNEVGWMKKKKCLVVAAQYGKIEKYFVKSTP